MLLCIVEDAKRTGGLLQHKRLLLSFRWTYLEDTGVLVVLWNTCWFLSHCEGSLLDCKPTLKIVVRHGSCHEPTYVTCWTKNRFLFPMQNSSWKSDNELRVSSVSSDLWCVLFQTDFNHIICSSFVFMFVRGGRWIFSTAAVRDVETMNSIKSLYL